MATGGLMHLWNRWGIHIMVLASFMLQVFLVAFGGIRRRSSSAVLRSTLWLAYLLADSTAIYTLGHLSIASRSGEHQLVAFWAPFLLLHLGGPDNITAYALEDNRLWLRHLQTLTVQVLGAAYVLYKFIAGRGTLLLLASISMFVAGLVKYCERIWALKCGNMSSIRVGFDDGESDFKDYDQNGKLLREGMSKGQILLRAHCHFDLCKSVFSDSLLTCKHQDTVLHDVLPAQPETIQYELVEMELSLMYDNLYTKAAVIHTWYGFYIHFIPLIGTTTAFLLFQLSINSTRSGNGYSRVDVVISYVLLVGALVLEVISFCRVVLSTWTCWFLNRRRSRGREWLLHVITPLRHLMRPATRKRLWAGSIGQHNLFHWCTRDRNEIGSRLAKKMGLQDWWNKLHFSGNFSPTSSFSLEDLKEEVLGMLMRMQRDGICIDQRNNFILGFNTRGSFTLESMGMYKGLARWSVDVDFEVSILVWHIATEAYICWSKAARPGKLVEAVRALSNYMMFLLLAKPDMLPGRTTYKPYKGTCKTLDRLWSGQPSPNRSWNPFRLVKELFHPTAPMGPGSSNGRIFLRWRCLMRSSQGMYGLPSGPKPGTWQFDDREALAGGVFLAKELLNMELPSLRGGSSGQAACEEEEDEEEEKEEEVEEVEGKEEEEEEEEEEEGREEEEHRPPAPSSPLPKSDMLELILGMWVEMMLYAGDRINRDSHARQLTNGGEFITILWLLAHYRNHVVF